MESKSVGERVSGLAASALYKYGVCTLYQTDDGWSLGT